MGEIRGLDLVDLAFKRDGIKFCKMFFRRKKQLFESKPKWII